MRHLLIYLTIKLVKVNGIKLINYLVIPDVTLDIAKHCCSSTLKILTSGHVLNFIQ